MSDRESESPEKPSVSIWKRLLIVSGLFVLLVTALGVGQYQWRGARARNTLEATLARLDETDPGWRLADLEAARPSVPDEENSAVAVVAVHRLLPKGSMDYKVLEPLDTLPPPPELLDAGRAALLERELTAVLPAVLQARRLAEMPVGRHRLALAGNPFSTLLTDQQNTRAVASLLRYDALRLAQKGDARGALRSSRALLNAGRSLSDEPFLISQLIRIACVCIAFNAVERTLALGEPPAEDLERLQALLQEEEKHPTLLVGLRGERGVMHLAFTGLADGSLNGSDLLGSGTATPGWEEMFMGWGMKGRARRDHPEMLAVMGRFIDNARLPPHEQPAAEKAVDEEIKKLPAWSLVRQLAPGTNKVAEATRRKLAFVRCLIGLLAVERHRQATGEWPARLEELTPKLLASVPLDPYDGKPLRYRRVKEGVIVYSVGPNGKDDGGMVVYPASGGMPADLGYRLWDVKMRRQPAKPPAPTMRK